MFDKWITQVPVVVIGAVSLVAIVAAAVAGTALRGVREKRSRLQRSEAQEGYVVSAVLGLLALLIGFTFSLAVDRFDTRRERVLESAKAVGTAYLKTQLLDEPQLILDIDRPTLGAVREVQTPMEELRKSMGAQPPRVFDRWHSPAPSQ